MKRVLIIDGNSYLYRAAYAFGTHNDGVIKGVFKYTIDALEGEDFRDLVVCWDKGKSRWRREIFPEYKSGRKESQKPIDLEAVHEQAEIIRLYLKNKNINQLYVKGIEADDLISWVSEYYNKILGYDSIIISTSDKDLWQLIDDKTIIHNHLKREQINERVAFKDLGVSYNLIPDFKSLAGDHSDNIQGVKGIGKKNAIELINKYKNIGDILSLDNSKELCKKKKTKKIVDQIELAELSYRLVKIPNLEEAKWYLNDSEYNEIIRRLGDNSKLDFFEQQMLADKMGNDLFSTENIPFLVREDLLGMKAFFDKGKEEKYTSLSQVDNSILKCSKCSLVKYCEGYGPTLPEGYEDVEFMIIGRNPGRDELEGGKPFIGRAGQRLDRFLEFINLTRRECWITNVNKCYSENNKPTTIGEITACSSYLKAEINLIKPKFIITFGNEAMAMLTPYGYTGVTKHCGEILKKPKGILGDIDAWVAICVHPSMALRNKEGELNMEYAAKQIKGFLDKRKIME